MDNNNYKGTYIFPPRPKTVTPPSGLLTYERLGYIGQPKMNGSCTSLILGPGSSKAMGRHNNTFTREIIKPLDYQSLYTGNGFMTLVGERMDKSKKDFRGRTFTGFVLFDILAFNGELLTNTTVKERQDLLDTLYPTGNSFDEYIDILGNNMYRAKNFKDNFSGIWDAMIKIDMYEGWVLKRLNGKLEKGLRESNNVLWQLKCRKPTKNYSH